MGEAIFRRVGKQMHHTPGSAVTAGDVVVVNTMPLVAERDIAANEQGDLTCEGIFEVRKDSSAFSAGVKVYWDEDGTYVGGSATGAATADSSKGHLMGVCESAKLTTDTTVFVKLTAAQEQDVTAGDMTEGAGISGATGGICEHRITKVGGLIKTEILIDVTGLNSGGTANDIIGLDGGTANCHLGQITAAQNGTIVSGRVTCFETPAGGDPDIDIYSAVEATGAQDAAITGLDETKLINHGDWTAEDVDHLDTVPVADGYLYLACGDATDADYTAGILLIELWGV